ncbi:hypothetical protein B0T26DRAFT_670792 [Lasiosphaeria miniovina]|uniref:Uncharacterized protein n=1 Tax=Lasiosphaeria miniovina TaxID=1954250 RepID=A0AA40BHU6_9PEZI|nr:uncharacterized protein B0T26DRAFT_670792 [Lasiosphaeria miniovina]KAK0734501.1 hypothetical protein B0T26DRAFT_670792 [Lasiosphaeria miniovina]
MGFEEIAQWKERNRKQQEQEGTEKQNQQRPTVFDLKFITPQHKSNVWNISYASHDDGSELPTAAAATGQQHQVLLASFHRRAHAGPSSLLAASTSAATGPNKFSQSPSNSAVFYTTSANTLTKTAPQTIPQPGGSGSNGPFKSSSFSGQRSAAEITDVPSLAVLSNLCRGPASASHLDKNNNIDEDNTFTATEEKSSRQLKTLNCGIGGASTLSSVLQRINEQLGSWSGRSGFNPNSSSDSVSSSSSSQQLGIDDQGSGNNHVKNKNDKTNNDERPGNQASGSGSGSDKNPRNTKDNNNNSDKPWPNNAPLPIVRQLPMFLGGGLF